MFAVIKKSLQLALPPILVAGLFAIFTSNATAVPAFTRKTGLPCASCHFGGTDRLTKFGRDFLYRGMRTADEDYPKDIAKSNILEYMSVGSEFDFNSLSHTSPSTRFDTTFHLNTGGPLTKNLGFYADVHLDGSGPEEGFLQYTSDPMADSFFFGRAGQIRPAILHDFGVVHSISATDMGAFSDTIWADQNDATGNPFVQSDSSHGVSLGYRTKSRLFFEAGVQNGPDSSQNGQVVFGSLEKILDEDGSSVGALAYRGDVGLSGPPDYTDRFLRVALFGSFVRENFVATGTYTWGKDNTSAGGTRSPWGFTLEIAKNLPHDITPYARYEFFDNRAGQKVDVKRIGISARITNLGRIAFEGFQQKTGDQTNYGLSGLLTWRF